MVVDRIENSNYIIQNNLISASGCSKLTIPVDQPYYADNNMMIYCYNRYKDYVYHGDNGEFMKLVNERSNNMKEGTWYLHPIAYTIYLTPDMK